VGKDYGERGVVEELDVDEINSERTPGYLIGILESINDECI